MFLFTRKYVFLIPLCFLLLTSCSDFFESITQGIAGALVGGVSGQIVHNRNVPHTDQAAFSFTLDSYAIVELREQLHSESSRVIHTTRIPNIKKFPIKFFLKLQAPLDISKRYDLSARVFSRRGNELQVGDLLTENAIPIQANQKFITLEVTGLEDCRDNGSGGFCK